MKIVRKRLSADEVIPSNIRYDPDTNQVQFSPDGGTTWYDTPGADPRHSGAFLYPPLSSGDPQCDAAANMVKWLKDFLDQATTLLGEGAAALTVLNAAIPLYELLTGGTLTLLAILGDIAGALVDVGYTALLAAFSGDEYDTLLCIFYCHIGSDGQVSAEELEVIQSEVTAQLNTTAGIVINALLDLQGEVGLSNAGAVGSETGDCSGCACEHCFYIDFTLSDGSAYGIAPVQSASPDNVTYSAGVGWIGGFVNSVNLNDLSIDLVLPSDVTLIDCVWTYDKTDGSGANNATLVRATHPHVNYYTTQVAVSTGGSAGTDLTKTLTYSGTVSGLYIGLDSGTSPASIILKAMKIRYSGTIPSGWSDNCP